ncbi:MAG: hypothetical protein QXR60_00735 [Candidatus Nanoarchaeia archaeon]
MGLFSKKKEEEKQELPPLKFPEFPKEQPSYESTIAPSDQTMIKRAISPPPSLMIPIRKPMPEKEEYEPERPVMRPRMEERPRPRVEERPRMEEYRPQRERTLFIKVDKYKDILAKMEDIKAKIAESEKALQKLQEINTDEAHELKVWQEDLNKVKDTLIAIDRKLFE